MSVYVMSDIHGEADMFHKMLEKVRFSDSDTLFILGDVIDRGPEGINLLLEIMNTPNMVMLLGNHEYMMMQYFSPEATEIEIRRWNRNGNAPTVEAYLKLDTDTQAEIMTFFKERPIHQEMTVDGKRFYLVHAFPGDNVHDEVWTRPAPDAPNPIPGSVVIIGHTPVLNMLKPTEEREGYAKELVSRGGHPRILHAPGFINIDCGCSYDKPMKTLGCLRLDDMAEFYVLGIDNHRVK